VKVKDNMSGKTFDVHAKSIVFAGGPFTDHMRKIENQNCKPAVAAAAGTHIVLPGYYCSRGVGMLDINTSDGRFLFFLPWQGKTLVGTTDRKGPVV
jgi:glycerol-3-phosphate dehydrogenase